MTLTWNPLAAKKLYTERQVSDAEMSLVVRGYRFATHQRHNPADPSEVYWVVQALYEGQRESEYLAD